MSGGVLRRFLFLLSKPDSDSIDGSTVVVRAKSVVEAEEEISTWKLVTECGVTARLLGERVGYDRHRKLIVCVPIESLPEHVRPEHVRRLENVVGDDMQGAA